MNDDFKSAFNIRSGVALSENKLVLLAEHIKTMEDDIEHTCLFQIEGQNIIQSFVLEWQSASVCRLADDDFIVLGESGDYFILEKNEERYGNIFEETSFSRQGIMRSGSNISPTEVIWVGMSGLVFYFDQSLGWKPYNEGVMRSSSLEDVTPIHSKSAVAYGWNGDIYHWVSHEWVRQDSPTNIILTCGEFTSNGGNWLAGQKGIVLELIDGTWSILETIELNSDIWDIHCFKKDLYIATYSAIYVFKNNQLLPVTYTDQIPQTFYNLTSNDKRLWSIGEKDIFFYENEQWKEILLVNPLK